MQSERVLQLGNTLVALILILSLIVPGQQKLPENASRLAPVTSAELGRKRSVLGLPKFIRSDVDGRDWYPHVASWDLHDSFIIFPVGKSDQRYYLSANVIQTRLPYPAYQWFMVYEPLAKGIVKRGWKIFIDNVNVENPKFSPDENYGTIDRFLANWSLAVRSAGSESATEQLDARNGLAVYIYRIGSYRWFDYFYVFEDGTTTVTRRFTPPQFGSSGVQHFVPPYSFPLPITPEEEADIKRLSAKVPAVGTPATKPIR